MTNLEVAQKAVLKPISEVAADFGLESADFEPIGTYKGKLTGVGISRLSSASKGKLVLVSAITPTTKGEGKTTVTVGLTQGINKLGRIAVSATREPALGPIFGVKGGACGGGYSQVLPMEDINLFFTGDFPAISSAHNLLSALLDAHIHNGNALEIDPSSDRWPRTVDMNDRALRSIVTGLGGKTNGPTRESAFVITPASEIMAALCLSADLGDLKRRLGEMVVAVNIRNEPVTAGDLGAHGAMTALLREAIRPNIVQTVEGGLALIHGGPFGNIAHGCSSLLGTKAALGIADFVVTEGGFGSDLGGEKFLNIVCPRLGRGPDTIVLVASVRALTQHGKGDLASGLVNLDRHLSHLRSYGPPVVVAINRFADDADADLQLILDSCQGKGIPASVCDPFAKGGEGCRSLAELVVECSEKKSAFEPLYPSEAPILEKLEKLVKRVYGGEGVILEGRAQRDLIWLQKHGFGNLPVCVAKTQYSLSDDVELGHSPDGFSLRVRGFRLSAGAGFAVAVCGEIMLMPGLGKNPAALGIDCDEHGVISGLF